jgi:hypothetical protein
LTDLAAGDLATIYPAPSPRVIAKARPGIDGHAAKFIGMSPFCVLATSGPDGSVDASPRGGNPGFIHVLSPTQLAMPDRSGNNRIDSFRNILEGSGQLQLIFFVPGIDETLRVGGTGKLSAEPVLLASMEEFGKFPRAVLNIAVRGVFSLRQGLDALKTVGAGHQGRSRGPAQHRPDHLRSDHAWRAGATSRDRGALPDAALGASFRHCGERSMLAFRAQRRFSTFLTSCPLRSRVAK